MEAKVKEEVPDKDYSQPAPAERRKSATSKEHRSPEQEESRVSPTPGPPSPQNNGTAESLSPPPDGPRNAPALQRLKRFLSALQQFAVDVSPDAGERVRQLIHSLLSSAMTIEEFQAGVQECTNYPLRASVPGFLRALLPPAQRDVLTRARHAKLTPLQYIRAHEHLVLESGVDSGDLFTPPAGEAALKRRASDPFYETSQTNGSHHEEYPPAAKRPPTSSLFVNPPLLYPLPSNASLFDYQPYHGYHGAPGDAAFERKDGGISVRDVSAMNAPFAEPRGFPGLLKSDDEWKSINTMLNCILSMVEKTKRALAILQQRGDVSSRMEPADSSDIKRAASEIMASAVRQTEERVAEVRRRAEDAVNQVDLVVNQVKRQALLELQRAVGTAEAKALELVAAERGKMERLLAERLAERRRSPPPPPDLSPNSTQQNCCWNCGRKAQETCSGCNAARYCGAFCQHKDWENHHQVCSGREQKPTTLLTISPPAATAVPKALARSTTPISNTNQTPQTTSSERHPPNTQERHPITTGPERLTTNENRLSLSSLNTAERMLSNQERTLSSTNSERIALASLSSAQGLIGGIGGKK